jgi:hypothetical protein
MPIEAFVFSLTLEIRGLEGEGYYLLPSITHAESIHKKV